MTSQLGTSNRMGHAKATNEERLKRLEEEVATLNSQMVSLTSQKKSPMADKDREILCLNEEMYLLKSQLVQLKEQLKAKDSTIERNNREYSQLQQHMNALRGETEEYMHRSTMKFHDLNEQMDQKNHQIYQQLRALEEKNRLLADKDELLKDLAHTRAYSTQLYHTLVTRDMEMEEKNREIDRLMALVKMGNRPEGFRGVDEYASTSDAADAPLEFTVHPHTYRSLPYDFPLSQQTSPSLPLPHSPLINRDWHSGFPFRARQQVVAQLFKTIFPSNDPAVLKDPRIRDIIEYSRKVEKDFFENSDNVKEYHLNVAEKCSKIQKELEEKKRKRLAGMHTSRTEVVQVDAEGDEESEGYDDGVEEPRTPAGTPPPAVACPDEGDDIIDARNEDSSVQIYDDDSDSDASYCLLEEDI